MKTQLRSIQFLLLIVAVCLSSLSLAKGDSLKFESMLTAVEQTAEGEGVISLMVRDFEVPVMVTTATDVEVIGDDIGLEGLEVGDYVKVEAYFAESGIVAEEIRLVRRQAEIFYIRGMITALTPDAQLPSDDTGEEGTGEVDEESDLTLVTLLGTDVYLDADTRVTRRRFGRGDALSAADLSVGDEVSIFGDYEAVLWARHVHIGQRQVGEIDVEGEVTELTESMFTVAISDGGTAVVTIDDDTEIRGELALESTVKVEGHLNADLSVHATEVIVDGAAPKFGHHRRWEIMGEGSVAAQMDFKALLKAVGLTEISGSVSGRFENANGYVRQIVQTELSGMTPGSHATVRAFQDGELMDQGDVIADAAGNASIEFSAVLDNERAAMMSSEKSLLARTKVEVFLNERLALQSGL